jgi:hypothetical protein
MQSRRWWATRPSSITIIVVLGLAFGLVNAQPAAAHGMCDVDPQVYLGGQYEYAASVWAGCDSSHYKMKLIARLWGCPESSCRVDFYCETTSIGTFCYTQVVSGTGTKLKEVDAFCYNRTECYTEAGIHYRLDHYFCWAVGILKVWNSSGVLVHDIKSSSPVTSCN